ncbi:hypothetical protein B0H17DRAFT_1202684 [Mycena rosella]|uniref:Uncharacterized protein n=1 Tax=Mycena rosella TaxID=1033263 RepID=A0AAD7GD47_MYCRO|nr:hypothetical protein B0H17DRAFT_1202684 [Mycena rosella]
MFYYVCIHLLHATREGSFAGQHITLIAGLLRLLKEEGLARDNPEGENASALGFLKFPTLLQLGPDIPILPGSKYIPGTVGLSPDPEYVKGDSFLNDLAQYGREHEAMETPNVTPVQRGGDEKARRWSCADGRLWLLILEELERKRQSLLYCARN